MVKSFPCVARCADGSPCGRRVTDGSNPPLCHIHKAGAIGAPFKVKRKSPEQVLDDLMHSRDESIRLRAADAFLKRQERETLCPRCAANRADERERMSAIHRLTHEQRCQVEDLIRMVRAILDMARLQALTWDEDRQQYIDKPEPTPIVPPPVVIAAAPVFEEPEDAEEEVEEIDRDPLTIPPDEV